MQSLVRPSLVLVLVAALGACGDRVTAPEADVAAQALGKLATVEVDGDRMGDWELEGGLGVATAILGRLDGAATRVQIVRDGRPETFNAVVFSYEIFVDGVPLPEGPENRRTFVAWQTPGVQNLLVFMVASAPEPFEKLWVEDTTEQGVASFSERHNRRFIGKQGKLYSADRVWQADAGVATISPASALEQRCRDGEPQVSGRLEIYGYPPPALACRLATFPVTFDVEVRSWIRQTEYIESLRFGPWDQRAFDPRPIRLVAPPQLVRGVRFELRCDRDTPPELRSRCPGVAAVTAAP